jgi:hypothetical protein
MKGATIYSSSDYANLGSDNNELEQNSFLWAKGSQPLLQGGVFEKELAKFVKRHNLGIYILLLFVVYLNFKKIIMKINKIHPNFLRRVKPVNPISNFKKSSNNFYPFLQKIQLEHLMSIMKICRS